MFLVLSITFYDMIDISVFFSIFINGSINSSKNSTEGVETFTPESVLPLN